MPAFCESRGIIMDCIYLCIYRKYLKYLDKYCEWVSQTNTRKKEVHLNISPQPTLEVQHAVSFDLRLLDFYVFGHLTDPTVCSCHFKLRDLSPTHFLCESNHSQPPCDLWNVVIVRDNKYPCMHVCMIQVEDIFSIFLMNSDIFNSMNSTVFKLVLFIAKMSVVNRALDM
jgi:hypothetical protein